MELSPTSQSRRSIASLELVGGRLALDFANTANWSTGHPTEDRLDSPSALQDWGRHVGVPMGTSDRPTDDLAIAVKVRALVRSLFLNKDQDATSEVRQLIEGLLDGELTASPDNRLVLLAVLFSALELGTSDRRTRVRMCAGTGCGWLFVDDSPAGRRRWCSMKDCGNRAKAQRHYHNRSRSDPHDT